MNWILNLGRILLCCVVFMCSISTAQTTTPDAANTETQNMQQQLLQGVQLLQSGRIQESISQRFDPVITYYEQTYRQVERRVYSARTQVESLMYLVEIANSNESPRPGAAVYSSNWGDAYYLKAYALIELKRLPEAKTALQAAIALGPRNAKYLGELGNLHLMERDWTAAKKIFDDAEKAAREFSPANVKTTELTRALRGQGFVLIEIDELDEAEKRYRASLEVDANDTRAKNQLAYITQRRAAALQGPVGIPTSTFNGNLATIGQAWQAAETQNSDPVARAYVRQWTAGSAAWNDNGVQRRVVMPHEKAIAECVTAVFAPPESARMVFTLDEKGLVVGTISDQMGYVAECIQSKLMGHRVPTPPKSPYYLCTLYQKRGDTGSLTSGCGPGHLATICEAKGTTTSCSVYQR